MDPRSGDVFRLREEALGASEPGDTIDREELRARLEAAGDATEDEARALEAERLVRVADEAAQKLLLGERELNRRERRRRARQRR